MFENNYFLIASGVGILVIATASIFWIKNSRMIFKHEKSDLNTLEPIQFFDSISDSYPSVEALMAEKDDSHPDPIVQCYVLAHYARFDLCSIVIRDSLKLQGANPKLLDIQTWLENSPSLSTWQENWISAEGNPIEAAGLLVSESKLTEARDLLEGALLNNNGDSAAIRKALAMVSHAICNPNVKLKSL